MARMIRLVNQAMIFIISMFIILSLIVMYLPSQLCSLNGDILSDNGAVNTLDFASVSTANESRLTKSCARTELVSFINVTSDVGLSGINGNFFAWGDYDNDGDLDLLVNGGRLFRNNGLPEFTFTEVTQEVGISGSGNGAWVDYDNDGNLDFYCVGTHSLWQNQGAPVYSFKDVSLQAGIVKVDYPGGAVGWGDYDLDGYLDMYIANGEDWNDGDPIYYPDFLYHNNGDGTFENVTAESGIRNFGGPYYGRGVAWGDYDNDGWPDVYISNYRISQNWLFHNNRNGTFTDVAAEKGVTGEESQRMGSTYYGHTVGSAWADLDNDGDFDLFESNLVHKDLLRGPICGDSQLYRNNGLSNGYSFTDVREDSNIPEKNIGGGEDELYVGIAIADFNNDGFSDLFIPQIYDLEYSYSYMYLNNGDWTFTNVSEDVGVLVWSTYGGAWGDYNNDGFLDLITGGRGSADQNESKEIHLYENRGNLNSWLSIKLTGDHYNQAGIGVRVKVSASNGLVQTKEVEGGMGCHSSQNSLPLEFGFGSYTGTVELEVIWPSGYIQTLKDVAVNQFIKIEETTQAPDIQFINVKVLEDNPMAGDTVTIEASIANMGYQAANSTTIRFYEGGAGNAHFGTEIGEPQTVDIIKRFHSAKVNTTWDTSGYSGYLDIWAVIEDVEPGEIDITNNAMNTTIYLRPENQPPIARLKVSPTDDIFIGDIIQFDGSNSTDDIGVDFYFFDFGDGNNSDWITNSEIYYQYQKAGEVTASLKVKDTDGAVSTISTSAQVSITINSFTPENRPPVIERFSANPSEVEVTEPVNLKVIASDPDSDELTYHFSASAGELQTKIYSSSATWHAPDEAGTYSISAKVYDGEFYSEQVSIDVEVIKIIKNTIPTIDEIIVTPQQALTDQLVTIKVIASDPDTDNGNGDELSYSYRTSGGTVQGTGETVSWRAPALPGIYFIWVTVTDIGGLFIEEEFTIVVVEPEHSPTIIQSSSVPNNIRNDKPHTVLFTVQVDDLNGLDDINSVKLDLSMLGGSEDQVMYDNGKFGDISDNDGIYSYEYFVSSGLATGQIRCKVTVRDLAGNEITEYIVLSITQGDSTKESESSFIPVFEGDLLIMIILFFVLIAFISNKKKS